MTLIHIPAISRRITCVSPQNVTISKEPEPGHGCLDPVQDVAPTAGAVFAVVLAIAAAELLLRCCVHRFGGLA